jgi:prevent-host-death family protein
MDEKKAYEIVQKYNSLAYFLLHLMTIL